MTYAKLFRHGRSQAVRLPRAFHFPGGRARVRRVGGGVLLEPVVDDLATWFAAMDGLDDGPFMPEGREQPPIPEREIDVA